MKPKLQPIAFPQESTPFGEDAFQPLVLPEAGFAITGGPNALFVVDLHTPPSLMMTVPAQHRIAGFAFHEGSLYIQDGTVLARWSLAQRRCIGAINVLQPAQRHEGSAPVDWVALHRLPEPLRMKQETIRRARRRVEWAALLDHLTVMRASWMTSSGRTDTVVATDRVIEEVTALLGAGGAAGARADLTRALTEGAALVISPPVVRAHQIWGKAAAMVFVLGRDATLHPLDEALSHMGTRRSDRAAIPALALTEFPTEADSDEWSCRLYYTTDTGVVQAFDGAAFPPTPLASWPTKGPADLDARLRPRVMPDATVWGAGAQGTGVYALTVDTPAEASRVHLPPDDWRWLEVRPEASLALVSTPTQTRLIGYARGVRTVDRWGPRGQVPPCFGTFLPASPAPKENGRPLLVLEVNCEARQTESPLSFRVLVANTVDAPDATSAAWYPPAPTVLVDGTLERWGTGDLVPMVVRTQPSVSRQDVYLCARTQPRAAQIAALVNGSGLNNWREFMATVRQRVPDPAAALGDLDLPPLIGADALFCYAIGNTITSAQADAAWQTLADLKSLARPVRLLIMSTERWAYLGDKRQQQNGPHPVPNAAVTLRFSNGSVRRASTDGGGWISLPPDVAGLTVTMDYVGGDGSVTSCRLDRHADNRLDQDSFQWM